MGQTVATFQPTADRLARLQAIHAPPVHEGLGNALRAAFPAGAAERDLEGLLARLR